MLFRNPVAKLNSNGPARANAQSATMPTANTNTNVCSSLFRLITRRSPSMNRSSNQESSLTVHIGKGILEKIVERANHDLPYETCGLLLGWRRAEEAFVTAYAPARNVSPNPQDAYEIDPGAILKQLAADEKYPNDDQTPHLVGVYHSHPRGTAQPSDRDLAECWPDMLNLIVAPKENQNQCIFFWHNHGVLHATDVDREASTTAELTRFSLRPTIRLHRGHIQPGGWNAKMKTE